MLCSLETAKGSTYLRVGKTSYRLAESAPVWAIAKRGLWSRALVMKEEAAANAVPFLKAGSAEYGLHTDDDREYFFSKFGDLVGVVRIKRRQDGSWSAKMEKSLLPRVLTSDAVQNGLMPEVGKSALPASLERVVPAEFQYWKQAGDEARATRDKLVESGFFTDDCLKAVDGELRKVEVKFFLYEPDAEASTEPLTLAAKFSQVVEARLAKSFNPFEEDDWLEALDKHDAPGALAILSSPEDVSPREMCRAVATLKSDWMIHCADTRAARIELAKVGYVFKLDGEPDLFAGSFIPVTPIAKAASTKTIEVQGIPVYIDRPVGFVQTGKDESGTEWSRTYQNDYGFFEKTQGGDGEELDVFIGANLESSRVFWVSQNKADGSFDEFKVFVGFDSPRDARDAYEAHIPMKFYAGMTETPISQLKALLGVSPVELAKAVSLDQIQQAMYRALREKFAPPAEGDACCSPGVYPAEIFTDHVVFCKEEKHFSVPYSFDRGEVVFSGEPVEVTRVWKPIEGASAGAEYTANQKSLRVVTKADTQAEQRYVLGIVLEPDIIDSQNDTYSADEIRQAEHKFMEDFRNMGLMHKEYVNEDVKILESYLAPADFELSGITVKKGTWLMGVRVLNDKLWKAVKTGGLTGFSIGGSAVRKPVAA